MVGIIIEYHASLEEYCWYICTVSISWSLKSHNAVRISRVVWWRNFTLLPVTSTTQGAEVGITLVFIITQVSHCTSLPYASHFGASTELRTYNTSLDPAGLLLWNFDAMWSVVSCWRLALDFRAILCLVSFELSWRTERQSDRERIGKVGEGKRSLRK